MTTADQHERLLILLKATANSLAASFQNYWPSDCEGSNDPCEESLAIHFGHHLLTAQFSVFAQVRHADGGRIDLLAITPERDLFLAFETKRLLCNKGGNLRPVIDDIARLRTFWLNKPPSVLGERFEQVYCDCQAGIGIVGGLLRVSANTHPLLEFWKSKGSSDYHGIYATQLARALAEIKAIWITPIEAWRLQAFGTFYLLAALFDLPSQAESGRKSSGRPPT